jgi:hypothetical protein
LLLSVVAVGFFGVSVYLNFWSPPVASVLPVSPQAFVRRLDTWQRRLLAQPHAAQASAAFCARHTRRLPLASSTAEITWLEPEAAPQQWATVAQLTVPRGEAWDLRLNAQGRRPLWVSDGTLIGTGCLECAGPDEDWVERGLVFNSSMATSMRSALADAADFGQGRSPAPGQPKLTSAEGGRRLAAEVVHARPAVVVVGEGVPGHVTYRLLLLLAPAALNVYKIFGDEANPLKFSGAALLPPPAELEGEPAAAAWGSFLTVGVVEGAAPPRPSGQNLIGGADSRWIPGQRAIHAVWSAMNPEIQEVAVDVASWILGVPENTFERQHAALKVGWPPRELRSTIAAIVPQTAGESQSGLEAALDLPLARAPD